MSKASMFGGNASTQRQGGTNPNHGKAIAHEAIRLITYGLCIRKQGI